MKVTVFGGSGFLGSHVADHLSRGGHQVTIFDLCASPYLQADQKMIAGNILNIAEVQKAVKGADAVYNFAGEADIESAADNPTATIQTNVMGNANILEACRSANVKRYIFASTVYVYSGVGSF